MPSADSSLAPPSLRRLQQLGAGEDGDGADELGLHRPPLTCTSTEAELLLMLVLLMLILLLPMLLALACSLQLLAPRNVGTVRVLSPPTHNREPYDTLLYCPTSCPFRYLLTYL